MTDDTCPVCGQSYVHKREERERDATDITIRDDFAVCREVSLKTERGAGGYNSTRIIEMYIHEPR